MIRDLVIIDDNDLEVELIKILAVDNHFAENVRVLNNGREGLAYFEVLKAAGGKRSAPELVLLDLHMPLMDGWEFLEAFSLLYRDRFPDTGFCLLTSSVNPQDKLKAYSYNCVVELLNKPLTVRHLNFLTKFLAERGRLFERKI
ncbi:response regulator [Telluribacter sp.]|jgi:CheY-like chemotaxis protein|uniref:response regulator n=1 Tax=Telluribacter sp. TaxID=1978767 RepID=UPI002E0F09AE|nr:response regulator [Telluribacter sp.]